jgi:hypothetical protein
MVLPVIMIAQALVVCRWICHQVLLFTALVFFMKNSYLYEHSEACVLYFFNIGSYDGAKPEAVPLFLECTLKLLIVLNHEWICMFQVVLEYTNIFCQFFCS